MIARAGAFSQHVACQLCGADDAALVDAEPIRTVICRNCALAYSDPQPDEGSLAEFYAAEYRRLYRGTTDPRATRGQMVARARGIVRAIGRVSGLRVLEVGCASGLTLAALRESGAHVEGIEPTLDYAAYARDSLGLAVHVGTYQTFVPRTAYDLIVLSHVLEHLPNPRAGLATFRSWLRGNGRLYVEVPNFLSYPWLEVAHLFNYTPDTLRDMLQRSGLRVDRIWTHSGRLGWRGLIYPDFYISAIGVTDASAGPFVRGRWDEVLRARAAKLRSPRRRLSSLVGRTLRSIRTLGRAEAGRPE